MATTIKQTSLDKVQFIAVENGWDVQVGKATVTIKDSTPGNGVGYGYRRRYLPRVQVEAWEVRLDNKVPNGHYGAVTMLLHFTEDGKYLAELTRSNGYHLFAGSPLRDALLVLERMAPAIVKAEQDRRDAERVARAAKEVNDAEDRVVEAQNHLDQARAAAVQSLRAVGVPDAMLDTALLTLSGPLMVYGLNQEARREADERLRRVMADQARV